MTTDSYGNKIVTFSFDSTHPRNATLGVGSLLKPMADYFLVPKAFMCQIVIHRLTPGIFISLIKPMPRIVSIGMIFKPYSNTINKKAIK